MGPPVATCFSHVFITRRGERLDIVPLNDDLAGQLVAMYLAYQPRDSFQGLPPLKDDECLNWVRRMIRDGINLVAISARGAVVGHVGLFPLSQQRCEFFLVVAPDYQNTGVGMGLARCAMQLARDIGYDSLWLSVEANNARARRLYRRCGFRCRSPQFRGDLEMALDLSSWAGEILLSSWGTDQGE